MEIKKIIIGTRGSKLALAQTKLVADALLQKNQSLVIETKIITTKGDINQSPIPLDTVGKAWFTEEIETALLDGSIDMAVHSLKDLQPDLPQNLKVMAVLSRADAADVLVSKSGENLRDLKKGAVVGTDSSRRKALLLDARSDLNVQSIRGNIDTRLKKLETEHYDAIVIAAAGLERLGQKNRVTQRLDPLTFIPPPGQGILAAEIKKDRLDLAKMLGEIVDAPTKLAAEIEQTFSQAVGGGCKLPVGCYTAVSADTVQIFAAVGTKEGNSIVRKSKQGRTIDGKKLAKELAKEF